MLHTKFQDHWTSGSGVEDFLRFLPYMGDHLGHVTCTIYINFLSHFPRRIHMTLALIGQLVSEKMFENNGYIHVYSHRTGADNPLRSIYLMNSIIQSI